jgi:pimeloyl-ACP methyl ester carboxylesterase
MDRVKANGVTVAYVDSGEGEPLVLLHGGEADHRMFDIFLRHLSPGIRTLAIDERDTGESVNPEEPYDMADLAADVAGFIEAVGVERAHVMGISFGGLIAITMAVNHPDRLKSVILAATSPGGEVLAADTERLKQTAVKAVDEGPEARDAAIGSLLASPGYFEQHPEILAEVKSVLITRPPDAAARRYAAWWGHDVCDQVSSITVPTLIVHGSDDRAVSVDSAYWTAERIPGAELVVLDGMRHGLTFEPRERVGALVSEFVLRRR